MRCVVCYERPAERHNTWCTPCVASYERTNWLGVEGGIEWAARRARDYERRRHRPKKARRG